MSSIKNILYLFLITMLSVLGISNAYAEYEPNDNYSSFVLSYQSSNFANPICLGTTVIECHGGVSGPAAVYARQIIPNLALGVSGSYLQSTGNTSSIKASNFSVFMQGIIGLGSRVDVGAIVAALNSKIELCSTNPDVCNATSDNGTDVGIFGKVFLNDAKSVNLGLSYDSVVYQKSEKQSVVALSLVSILAKRHRIALSVDKTLDSSGQVISGGYGFGYSYLVY